MRKGGPVAIALQKFEICSIPGSTFCRRLSLNSCRALMLAGLLGLFQAQAAQAAHSFSPAASMGTARWSPGAAALPDGRVLVAGGRDGSTNETNTAEIYDPVSDTWSPAASMSINRYGPAAVPLPNGKILFAGGRINAGEATSSAEIYDPATNTWSPTGSMTQARYLPVAAPLPDGRVLVSGGFSGTPTSSYLSSTEIYDPVAGTFSPGNPLSTARSGPASSPLLDGRVLVAGGSNTSGTISSVEIFDPVSGNYSPGTSLTSGVSGARASLMPDGKVLIIGGNFSSATSIYDAATGTSISGPSLGDSRSVPGVAPLPDGLILVAGGASGVATLASAEIFQPAIADLGITKTDGVTEATPGGSLTYTITASNSGPENAVGASVADNFPAALDCNWTCVGAGGGTCSASGSGDISDTVNLPAGGSVTYKAACGIDPAASGTLANTATVAAPDDVSDPDPADNSASDNDTQLIPHTDLSITKNCSDEVVAGSGTGNYSCSLSVTNNGPSLATNVTVNDTIAALAGVSDALPGSPSQGSANVSAGVLVWTAGVLSSGTSATLDFTRTVSLEATEGMLSNTASVSGTEFDPDGDNNSSLVGTNIRWPQAAFSVVKEYTAGGAGPVNVTLQCSDTTGLLEYSPQTGTTPTDLVVRRFDAVGTSCTVTEDEVPPGYYLESLSEECDVSDAADGGSYACTLTNAPVRATFRVTKIFDDGNAADEISVAIDCNTGLLLDQEKSLRNGEWVEFVVTSFTEGVLQCTITEDGQAGYSGVYQNLTVPGAPVESDESCFYAAENIVGNSAHECMITNSPDPVDVVITKEWLYPGSSDAAEVSNTFQVLLICDDADIAGGNESCQVNSDNANLPQGANSSGSCLWLSGVGDMSFSKQVIPHTWPGGTCWAVEVNVNQAVEVDNGCASAMQISAGSGASCTITNTVFYEGIPTLSQYGLALLALLMLCIGTVGIRRMI